MVERKGGRDLVERTVVVNMERYICTIPQTYSYGYGDETEVAGHPRTIEYPSCVPAAEWVSLRFDGGVLVDMYVEDYREAFGKEPPVILRRKSS